MHEYEMVVAGERGAVCVCMCMPRRSNERQVLTDKRLYKWRDFCLHGMRCIWCDMVCGCGLYH